MSNDATEIAEKVRKIIAEQAMLEADQVTPDAGLQDLGLDSLGLVEIVFAIEEEFEVSVPYNANDPDSSDFDISSVQAVTDAVHKLVAEKAG